MIFVVETYFFKPEYTSGALAVLQELDNLLGPNAHKNPGHCGHARFMQDANDPTEIRLLYDWRDENSFLELARSEELLLREFLEKYCRAPRRIQLHQEIPVEIDHDHEGMHAT